jgi:4-amino-4-deoxychorismate lyase
VLLKAEAERSNYDDLLVTDSAGFVTECCAANIFFALEGVWHTPKLTRAGVAGVMREWLFSQIEVIEDDFSLATVRQAEAMFISNALIGIVPVRSFELKKLDISPVLQLQTALKLKGCK